MDQDIEVREWISSAGSRPSVEGVAQSPLETELQNRIKDDDEYEVLLRLT